MFPGGDTSRHDRGMTSTAEKASTLLRLHTDRKILTLVNVWDVASARAVAAVEGTTAIATASHGIAATLGFPDGEQIPVDLMLDMVGRIAEAVDVPVTADLEAGYGDPAETIRRAVGLGVVGANLEDQLKPVAEAASAVAAALGAAHAEGVADFVLNARTDAFLRAGDQDRRDVLRDAIARGRAYLDAGAPVVFVPGLLQESEIEDLVDALGDRKVSLIGSPGMLPASRLEQLGVARLSFGPYPQRVALTALQELVEAVDEGVPPGTRMLT
jgi:2-methylisocitrate lyase-like PEP mutase family enzyme